MRSAAAEAALRAINMAGKARKGVRADAGRYAEVSKRITRSYRQRLDRYTDHDGASTLGGKTERIERELRLVGLRAERDEVLKVGPVEGIQEEALRKLVREIDLQEARHSS